ILRIGPSFALKAERVLEVKGDNRVAREAQHEIPQRADANRVRNLCTLSIIELRMTRINLHARRGDDAIDQVIGLHAEALASAHLDERAVLIFLAEHIAELLRGARCEPYERVVEVRVL